MGGGREDYGREGWRIREGEDEGEGKDTLHGVWWEYMKTPTREHAKNVHCIHPCGYCAKWCKAVYKVRKGVNTCGDKVSGSKAYSSLINNRSSLCGSQR